MRRSCLYAIGIIGLLGLSIFAASAAAAEGPVLDVDPNDTPLVIRGVLDEQTTAFSANVRLTVTGGDAEELWLMPTDLQHQENTTVAIDRANVTIPAGIRLSNGQPRDVRITISNIIYPGDYDGELGFLVPGQAKDDALVIPLKLHIGARPEVKPIVANLGVQVVRCQNSIDCALAAWLLPNSVVRDDWDVQLDNRTLLPVEVIEAAIVMQGERTGSTVGINDMIIAVPHTLPANQVETIALTIFRNRLSPDRYQGMLRLKLENANDPVIVNVALDVRDGPLGPLLVVLAGIIVGRLVRGMETPEARKQVKLLPRFYRLQADSADVTDPSAVEYLSEQLKITKQKIEASKDPEEALAQLLDKLQARIGFLVGLESLERQLKSLRLDALSEELKPNIQSARQALLDEKVERAERLRKQVEKRLRRVQEDGTMGAAADHFERLLNALCSSGSDLTATEAAAPVRRPGGDRWGWLAQLMATLSGARLVSADVRYWLIRPLLWLILLGMLVLLGMQTLYVNAGATFGAAGLYDYLGLFLWGLSADVAQRTLQNLRPLN